MHAHCTHKVCTPEQVVQVCIMWCVCRALTRVHRGVGVQGVNVSAPGQCALHSVLTGCLCNVILFTRVCKAVCAHGDAHARVLLMHTHATCLAHASSAQHIACAHLRVRVQQPQHLQSMGGGTQHACANMFVHTMGVQHQQSVQACSGLCTQHVREPARCMSVQDVQRLLAR